MWALHNVLNMPEYALTELWIYLGSQRCQDSEYVKVVNKQELCRVPNISQHGLKLWISSFGLTCFVNSRLTGTYVCSFSSQFSQVVSKLHILRNFQVSEWEKKLRMWKLCL